MSSILLIGPPGSGKTEMACLTAVRKPVHVIDVDRKIRHSTRLDAALLSGELTVWELDEPLVDQSLATRARLLAKNENPSVAPKGWLKFSQLVDDLDTKEEAKKAGTLLIDSYTLLAPHLEAFILFHDEKGVSTMSPRNWGSFGRMWAETTTILRDWAAKAGKDLIITVHERTSEVPGPHAKAVKSRDIKGNVFTDYTGTMDLRVAASIDGQFGIKIGAYFEEVYGLSVVVEGGEPRWVCRVHPDGKRDLRTARNVTKSEYPPDFRVIWGGE